LLALTGSTQAAAFLKPLLDDANDQVREVAAEALEQLEAPAAATRS
jgi:HEAT repeat protein